MLARPIPPPMTSPPSPPLSRYRQKRNFAVTSEPAGAPGGRETVAGGAGPLSFVVQKHWATPAALRLSPRARRRPAQLGGAEGAVATTRRRSRWRSTSRTTRLDYASFEGTIPPRQYGAGTVIVWDRGTWEPVGDPRDGMAEGKLVFTLHGEKLAGLWELVRIAKPGDKQDAWMLFKKKDAWARPLAEYDVIAALPDSVVARPLGLVEEREPRARRRRARREAAVAAARSRPGGAVRAPLPAKLEPQLATLAATAPRGRLDRRDQVRRLSADGARRQRQGEARSRAAATTGPAR